MEGLMSGGKGKGEVQPLRALRDAWTLIESEVIRQDPHRLQSASIAMAETFKAHPEHIAAETRSVDKQVARVKAESDMAIAQAKSETAKKDAEEVKKVKTPDKKPEVKRSSIGDTKW